MDKLNKILNKKTASKAELRSALAESLGVELPSFFEKETETLFKKCKSYFMEKYYLDTNLDYYWVAKDSLSLSMIIKKLYGVSKNKCEYSIFNSFKYLILHLPKWYIENGFSPCVINSKFNEIIKIIKNNGKQKSTVSEDYKARIIRDLS